MSGKNNKSGIGDKIVEYGKEFITKEVTPDNVHKFVKSCISYVMEKDDKLDDKSEDSELQRYKDIIETYKCKIVNLETELLSTEDDDECNKLRVKINEHYSDLQRVKMTKETLEESYITTNEHKRSENKINAKYLIGMGAPLMFMGGLGLGAALKNKETSDDIENSFEEETITEMMDENY
ncbi:hypothetical protein [Paraclostridium bifermentans]|uniref:hypothetical protein n=1 Tax=Paraclostridium bifermentans TaxID=1490 RepID=UPI00374FD944